MHHADYSETLPDIFLIKMDIELTIKKYVYVKIFPVVSNKLSHNGTY